MKLYPPPQEEVMAHPEAQLNF